MADYEFKIASESWEYEQIHRLNYETFVNEIPQHSVNPDGRLVDKFHDENTYIICLKESELIGMVAVRDKRPFSLDEKINDLDSYLPFIQCLCEIRLLSIKTNHRKGKVIRGLFEKLAENALKKGYELALISGTVKQIKLYRRLGFIPFSSPVGSKDAKFQPMYLTFSGFEKFKANSRILGDIANQKNDINFLTGPVHISKQVRNEFTKTPVSHRSKKFIDDFKKTKSLLTDLTNTKNVEILFGSGTLANDAVAAQLKLLNQKGLILSNGEFGSRLIDHASRMGLDFNTYKTKWGEVFDYDEIDSVIQDNKFGWLWFVHCETSTGILNDLDLLSELCRKNKIKLCADCISSIGNISLNLSSVYLATGASGKGLMSYSGLAFVFYNHKLSESHNSIPRYLDLCIYKRSEGVPFTVLSNLVYALKKSLENINVRKRYIETKEKCNYLGFRLCGYDFEIVSDKNSSLPSFITISLPKCINSSELGCYLENTGLLINYMSEYFLKRNWIQISLMSGCDYDELDKLISNIKQYCFYHEKVC